MYSYDLTPNIGYTGAGVWVIVSLVLAIIGGIVLYFLFVKKDVKSDNKYVTFAKEFFDFKKMIIEDLLKVVYFILAIYITLSSFALIGTNFFAFLLTLILGNVMLRLVFEELLVLIMIWKNTTVISKKINTEDIKVTKKKKED